MDPSQSREFGNQLKVQLAFWRWPFLLDYIVLIALAIVSRRVQYAPAFEHSVLPRLGDRSISYEHLAHQTVPEQELYSLTFYAPAAIIIALGLLRINLAEIHSGLLSYFAGWNMLGLFVGFVKNRVGRLRPDFLSRCQFDMVKQVCTGDAATVMEGRRSFPSGHSSAAFLASVYLMLLFAGKTRSLCFSAHGSSGVDGPWRLLEPLQSKLLRLVYTLSPILPGAYIAISRFEDHVHHPTDILAGSALGTLFALLLYHVYWPSPFVPSNIQCMGEPRALYWSSGGSREGERAPLLADDSV